MYSSGANARDAALKMQETGGMLVKVSSRNLSPGEPIEIAVSAGAAKLELKGRVLQSLGDRGVAITFEISERVLDGLTSAAATSAAENAYWSDEQQASPTKGQVPIREKIKTANKAERIALALHGSKPERNLLIRDRDKSLHQYVIRNPKIGIDEVASIAKMSAVAPDVLAFIAAKREWFSRPEIAAGLIRNPKVSAAVAKKLMQHVSERELRLRAKGAGVREAIAQEARRRLLRRK